MVARGENTSHFHFQGGYSHIRHAAISVSTVPSGVTSVGNSAVTKVKGVRVYGTETRLMKET